MYSKRQYDMDLRLRIKGELKQSSAKAPKNFEGAMLFVSQDRMFLRGLGSRVLELGGESGTDTIPLFILGHTLGTCRSLDMKRLGSIRRPLCNGVRPICPRIFLRARDSVRRASGFVQTGVQEV